jgi:hypothetical protein
MKAIGIVLAILIVTVASADESALKSDGHLNGRAWTAMTPDQKLTYISGFREGVEALAMVECDKYECFSVKARSILPYGAINSELVDCLDDEFRDPALRIVPIATTMRKVCKPRFEGEAGGSLDRIRAALKSRWRTELPQKP